MAEDTMASATLENSILMVMASIMLARGIVTSPLTSLLDGIITLHIYNAPPVPAQEIDFILGPAWTRTCG